MHPILLVHETFELAENPYQLLLDYLIFELAVGERLLKLRIVMFADFLDLFRDLLQSLAIFVEDADEFVFVLRVHGSAELSASLKQLRSRVYLDGVQVVGIRILIVTLHPHSEVDWGAGGYVLLVDVAGLIDLGDRGLGPTVFGYVVFEEVHLLGSHFPWFLWLTALGIILLILVVEGRNKSVVFRLLSVHSELIFENCEHSLYFFQLECIFILSAVLKHKLIW